jgi:hypothetical protein
MASFDDLDQYLETGDRLKVRGKVYTVPPRSAALGIWCRRIVQTAGELTQATTDEELREVGERAASRAATMPSIPDPELSFEEQLLGPAYAEMLADNVPDDYLVFCARTIFIKLAYGEEYAERWWRSGGHPEAGGGGGTEPGRPQANWRDQYGRGRYDDRTGLYEWYDIPPQERPSSRGRQVAWRDILTHWQLVEADLHSAYGIDVEDRDLMRRRSWRWLEARIVGLLAADTRLHRALTQASDQEQ